MGKPLLIHQVCPIFRYDCLFSHSTDLQIKQALGLALQGMHNQQSGRLRYAGTIYLNETHSRL